MHGRIKISKYVTVTLKPDILSAVRNIVAYLCQSPIKSHKIDPKILNNKIFLEVFLINHNHTLLFGYVISSVLKSKFYSSLKTDIMLY